MKPALVKKWIDSLNPTQHDSTTDKTTNSKPGRTLPTLQRTSHSSTMSSPRVPISKSQRYGEPRSPSSYQEQHSGSTSGHYHHHPSLIDSLQILRARSTRARDLRIQAEEGQVGVAPHHELLPGSTPLGSHDESEFTIETMDDCAIPPQLNLRLHDYELCDLLWLRPNLEGQEVTGARHPFHHTHYDLSGVTTRFLVVFLAAVCLPEEYPYFKPAGIGVFFNKYSALNISDSFSMTYQLDSSRSGARGLVPHLVAARNALRAVRTEIVPGRIQLIRNIAISYGWTELDVQDVARFHLIVGTDSQDLLDEIRSWKSSDQLRRLLDVGSSGDRDSLVDLLDQIEALSSLGIQVVWSLVSERWNRPANKLAADAVIGHCSRLDGKKPSRVTGSRRTWKQETKESNRGVSVGRPL
jgi:hypothetical protein